jgi:hydroxyacylglutathione hydrolase
MRIVKRVLVIAGAVVVVLLGLAVVGIRSSVGRFSAPTFIAQDFGEVVGGGVRVFGARSGNKVLLFDAGLDQHGRGVDALLAALHATRADVSDVFLTHGHGDHIAAAPLFPNARIHGGAGDVGLAATGEPVEAFAAKLMRRVMGDLIPSVRVTDPLQGRSDVFVAGDDAVTCLPMPGHTPGSYAYLYRGMLVVGDAMNWDGKTLVELPSMFEARPEQSRQAIRQLATLLQGLSVERVCTAHAGCTPAGRGRVELDAFIARLGP